MEKLYFIASENNFAPKLTFDINFHTIKVLEIISNAGSEISNDTIGLAYVSDISVRALKIEIFCNVSQLSQGEETRRTNCIALI